MRKNPRQLGLIRHASGVPCAKCVHERIWQASCHVTILCTRIAFCCFQRLAVEVLNAFEDSVSAYVQAAADTSNFSFDMFQLAEASGNRPLSMLACFLMKVSCLGCWPSDHTSHEACIKTGLPDLIIRSA